MVECQSTSRHMINWLINQLDAEKDGIFLAVTKAQDQHGKVGLGDTAGTAVNSSADAIAFNVAST